MTTEELYLQALGDYRTELLDQFKKDFGRKPGQIELVAIYKKAASADLTDRIQGMKELLQERKEQSPE